MEELNILENPTKEVLEGIQVRTQTFEESSIIEALRRLKNYIPLPSERESRENTLKKLVRKWFSQRIEKEYDRLSSDLFQELLQLKQKAMVNSTYFVDSDGRKYRYSESNKMVEIEIPMIARAEYGKDDGWRHEIIKEFGYERYKLSLFSKMPKIPLEVKDTARNAISLVYKTYADALSTEVLNEIIMENPSYAPSPTNAKLLVLWKPNLSEIQIKTTLIDRDPALILHYDNPYLVATWREPDEEPFMNLLYGCISPTLDSFTEKE